VGVKGILKGEGQFLEGGSIALQALNELEEQVPQGQLRFILVLGNYGFIKRI